MDFQIIDEETLKLKGKKVNLAVDPKEKISKFDADAILSTDKLADTSRINNYRILIDGAGEYEVSGLKISGLKSDNGIVFELTSENANVLIARASAINNMPADKLGDYKVIVLNADADINQTVVTAMEPNVVILYGKLKKEAAKKLGSDQATVSSKFSVSEDKLPEEMEVLLLG